MDSKFFVNIILLLIFIYASIGNLLTWGFNKPKWNLFTKPLLMPVMAVYYVLNSGNIEYLLVFALFFAFLGDVFLIWPNKKIFFTGGLVFFLIMQLLYIIFIIAQQLSFSSLSLLAISSALIFLLAGIIIYLKLFNYLNEMKIPVLIYMLVILIVGYLCFLNMINNSNINNIIQFVGAIIFIVSDTILAFDSFKRPLRLANVWIMATYITAQLFLFVGFMNT